MGWAYYTIYMYVHSVFVGYCIWLWIFFLIYVPALRCTEFNNYARDMAVCSTVVAGYMQEVVDLG